MRIIDHSSILTPEQQEYLNADKKKYLEAVAADPAAKFSILCERAGLKPYEVARWGGGGRIENIGRCTMH